MTNAIDEATAVLEEAATLTEGSEPSIPNLVADAAETPAVDSPTADASDDSGPSDALDEPQDVPTSVDAETSAETSADAPSVEEKSDCRPTDRTDAVDETATIDPEVPRTNESPEATPGLNSDTLIAEDAPPSEPTPDQSPTPSAVSVGTDPQMHELVARLKGISGKISRAVERLGALEGENRDQARTIERLQQEAGDLRSENAALKAEAARLAENETARATLDEIEQKLETAGV